MSDFERELLDHLQQFLTAERVARFQAVLQQRTRWLTVCLADLYQSHNASAVLRSCDAFGVQDVHVIETFNTFEANVDISRGTDQWLTLHRHQGPQAINECCRELHERGYKIVSTVLHHESRPLCELTLGAPVALFFGAEKEGLPDEVIERSDELVHLPMYGFVESFNVSVAAALALQTLTEKLRNSPHDWSLTKADREELTLHWTRNTVSNAEAIEKRFCEQWNGPGNDPPQV